MYAAKLLGLSVGTVQSLVEKNELQAWRTRGGHRRISLQSIRDYQRLHGLPSDGDKDALMRVLVVDDSEINQEIAQHMLVREGAPLASALSRSARG